MHSTSRHAHIGSQPGFGILEWFHFQEHAHVERTLESLDELGVDQLRTGISWADWMRPEGPEWIAWLFERFAREDLEVLPCFLYTPPSEGEATHTASPPRRLRSYADFVDEIITRFGEHFECVELWNEPNNQAEWDFTRDPEYNKFAQMVINAANWARECGKRTVLGGMSPIDPGWLEHIIGLGVLDYIDVVGVHGFPGTWEKGWTGWAEQINAVQEVLGRYGYEQPIWITEAGYSTRNYREYQQLEAFLDALEAPAERLYWYGLYDLASERSSILGFHLDEREYHCGIKREDGRDKLLYRLICDDSEEAVREVTGWPTPHKEAPTDAALITGGAGFLGSNIARRLLSQGRDVVIFDNLSRPGVEANLRWLTANFEDNLWVQIGDVRDAHALRRALDGVTDVFHMAAQTAVTTSLEAPKDDFTANAQATLNLLEEIRSCTQQPSLVFTSTNKVYGRLGDIELAERDSRWEPVDHAMREQGVGEDRGLKLCSPYGCSKGAAEQYVLDYAQTFGLDTCVFRMSCVYGPRQFGTEDQGWVAHFLIRALEGEPITIFGDGKQVRDILFVDDFVDAALAAASQIDTLSGQAFNIGGGPANTTSLLELIDMIEQLAKRAPTVEFDAWRPGDQRYYVSDTTRFEEATGWRPRVGRREGLERLLDWLEHFHLGQSAAAPDEIVGAPAEAVSNARPEGG